MDDPKTLEAAFSLGIARVDGPLPPDMVGRIAAARRNEVRYCYHRMLAQHPELEGDLVVDFEIASNGVAENAVVSDDDLSVPSVGECVANAIGGKPWRFPTSSDGARTNVRLVSAIRSVKGSVRPRTTSEGPSGATHE